MLLPSFALGDGFDAKQGMRVAPLAPWTYKRNQTWLYPYNSSGSGSTAGRRFAVPDGVSLSLVAAACLKFDGSVMLEASVAADLAAKFSFAFASFKLSRIHVKKTFLEAQAAFALAVSEQGKARVSLAFSLDLFRMEHPSLFSTDSDGLASPFQTAVAALPPPGLPSAAAAYTALIHRFGTHYVSAQTMGGFCNFTVDFDEKATAAMSVEYKYMQSVLKLSLSFFRVLKIPLVMIKDAEQALNTSADATFEMHSHASFQCTGGQPAVLGTAAAPSKGSWKRWLRSIGGAPAPIERSKRLRALSDFVPDAATRTGLHSAIAAHLNGATTPVLAPTEALVEGAASGSGTTAAATPAADDEAEPEAEAEAAAVNRTKPATVGVPGVCSGWGGTGVGCGYDATRMEAFGMTINPKKPVIQMPACAAKCYANPDDQSAECANNQCTYSSPFVPNMLYKVPSNVHIEDTPQASQCFRNHTSSKVDDYTSWTQKKTGHHGFFHSWSKTVSAAHARDARAQYTHCFVQHGSDPPAARL
jgi:hypothetical protein